MITYFINYKLMCFCPVNEMVKLVLYLFFLILHTRNMSLRTPI